MQTKKSIVYSAIAVLLFTLVFAACESVAPGRDGRDAVPTRTVAPAPAVTTVPEPDTSALEELSRAIRDVSDYLNDNIPAGSMLVFVNVESRSVELSDFIIDDLIANAVNDRIFTVVDRQRLDLIREEQGFQLSWEVDEETALSIGRFFGAQTIVTGRVTTFGGHFRLTIRALDVGTARVQGQYNRNIGTERAITALIGGGGGHVAQAPRPHAERERQAVQTAQQVVHVPGQTTVQPPAQATAPAQAARPVVIIEGASLADSFHWLQGNAVSNTEYRIVVTANESIIPQTLSFSRVNNVTVRLVSDGGERVLSLPGSGTHFTIESGVTLILDSGITLQGRDNNNAALVVVNRHGSLLMEEGARITGNRNNRVAVGAGDIRSGGVFVNEHGTFTMNNGEISNNTYRIGGGVRVARNGSFIMAGGIIYNNTADIQAAATGGGGVHVEDGATFSMTGGELINNISHDNGGGVFVRGTFNMSGGEISGNTAIFGWNSRGGGVMVDGGSFIKTGGTIYGFGSVNENRAMTGYAVQAGMFSGFLIRNSTAGPGVRMDSSRSGAVGGWEN